MQSKIYLSPPHMSGREEAMIQEAFMTNWIAPVGPHVDMFEKEFADCIGVKDAVAVNSGTAAIHLALLLLDVKRGDRVFCSTLTFVASANPILYQGAEPVFIDSEPDSWNMSPRALKKAFQEAVYEEKLPKAVIVVNLYGQSAKMDEIMSICKQFNVPVIEDAAESLGATFHGKPSGTIGDIGCFSFNGNKIITTSGGGMLISNNPDFIKRTRFLASQARDDAPHYQHSTLGYNYGLSNLLAGVGREQLKVLNDRMEARREIFNYYYNELSTLPGVYFMRELANTQSNRWLTTFYLNDKETNVTVNQLIKQLADENIEARPVWKPLHLQPLFKGAKYYSHGLNTHIAEQLFSGGICLPSGSNLTLSQQDRIISCIRKVFKTSNTSREYLVSVENEL